MHLALGLVSLPLLVYVAGRPVLTEPLEHAAGRLSLEDAGASSSSTPTYEDIPMSGGQILRLKPELVNEIWGTRNYVMGGGNNNYANQVYRARKGRLGVRRDQPLPSDQRVVKVSGPSKRLSRPDRHLLRRIYVGLQPGDPARKEYSGIPFDVLEQAHYAYEKDREHLNKKMEIMKAYAKHAIETRRVLIDEESQSLRPLFDRPRGRSGRQRQENVAPSTLRYRKWYDRMVAARNAGLEAEQGQESTLPVLQQQGTYEVDSGRITEHDQPPQRWTRSQTRSLKSRRASSSEHHLEQYVPELVWPSTVRRPRTPRIAVDDEVSEGIHYGEEYEPELVWPSTPRRQRTPRFIVYEDADGTQDGNIALDHTSNQYQAKGKTRRMKDLISHSSTAIRSPSSLSPTPSFDEYIQFPPSSPTRLRNDGLYFDLNIEAGGEYDLDSS